LKCWQIEKYECLEKIRKNGWTIEISLIDSDNPPETYAKTRMELKAEKSKLIVGSKNQRWSSTLKDRIDTLIKNESIPKTESGIHKLNPSSNR
jgi:hypothetical protein